MVEHFYNNQKFTHALEFIIKVNGLLPSKFYEMLSTYWHQNGWQHKAHNQDTLYQVLEQFYQDSNFKYPEVFKSIVKFDYVRQSSRRKLYQTGETSERRQKIHAFLQCEDNISKYLPTYSDKRAKAIVKQVRFETFEYDVIEMIQSGFAQISTRVNSITVLFDYSVEGSPFEKSRYHKVVL
jgi:hypothetical protein